MSQSNGSISRPLGFVIGRLNTSASLYGILQINKHLMTGLKANNEFCFPETLNVSRGEVAFTRALCLGETLVLLDVVSQHMAYIVT